MAAALLLSPEAFTLYGALATFAAGHINQKYAVLYTAAKFLANVLAPKK